MAWHIGIDEPAPFELLAPKTLQAALELSATHGNDGVLLAGGCDVLDQLKHQWRTPRYVINLKTIPGLRGVSEKDGFLTIGALTTLTDVVEHARLQQAVPGYPAAAGRVAIPQIRNLGTVAGNLLQDSRCPYYRGPWQCYRAGGIVCDARHGINIEHALFGADRCFTVTPSDTAPMLVALDAEVTIHDAKGAHRLPVAELFVGPGEDIRRMHRLEPGQILTEIHIPVRQGQRSGFRKAAMREGWDFAAASAAVSFVPRNGSCTDVRIVLGAVAATPWRSAAAEAVLSGRALTADTIEAAAVAAVEGAEPLMHNGYKVPLAKDLVRTVLTELM